MKACGRLALALPVSAGSQFGQSIKLSLHPTYYTYTRFVNTANQQNTSTVRLPAASRLALYQIAPDWSVHCRCLPPAWLHSAVVRAASYPPSQQASSRATLLRGRDSRTPNPSRRTIALGRANMKSR